MDDRGKTRGFRRAKGFCEVLGSVDRGAETSERTSIGGEVWVLQICADDPAGEGALLRQAN
jgi:hypothetical protein